ncbi:hypothetical protein OSB04_028968 [Centaurea solstitialis]|uniref:Uncharacterized protein n=1 Tax=Centaurea solstitialis TaxID=347529 RepID=A0AA38W156_9ASTR|nr:hypothetical protein OSB04_028968 [Centaurea solstitialis]
MMISKSLIASLLVLFVLVQLIQAYDETDMSSSPSNTPNSSLQDIDCGEKCASRCSKASRTKMCLRACGTCCKRCHCVPPGTYGNYDDCPCYADLTTHGGRRKCP